METIRHEEYMRRMAEGPKPDMVNKPPHYQSAEVECIDAIKASMTPEAFKGYLKGTIQKYLWRYEEKHVRRKSLDLFKANGVKNVVNNKYKINITVEATKKRFTR